MGTSNMPTAKLPSWARANAAFEAGTGEDMAWLKGQAPAQTPEEAYGFDPNAGEGVPGRIKGSTAQMDMTAMRAWRNGTSLTPRRGEAPRMTSQNIDQRVRNTASAERQQRQSVIDAQELARRSPYSNEIRNDTQGNPWRYNATLGRGEKLERDARGYVNLGAPATQTGKVGVPPLLQKPAPPLLQAPAAPPIAPDPLARVKGNIAKPPTFRPPATIIVNGTAQPMRGWLDKAKARPGIGGVQGYAKAAGAAIPRTMAQVKSEGAAAQRGLNDALGKVQISARQKLEPIQQGAKTLRNDTSRQRQKLKIAGWGLPNPMINQ